jgi:hypothetical protein
MSPICWVPCRLPCSPFQQQHGGQKLVNTRCQVGPQRDLQVRMLNAEEALCTSLGCNQTKQWALLALLGPRWSPFEGAGGHSSNISVQALRCECQEALIVQESHGWWVNARDMPLLFPQSSCHMHRAERGLDEELLLMRAVAPGVP